MEIFQRKTFLLSPNTCTANYRPKIATIAKFPSAPQGDCRSIRHNHAESRHWRKSQTLFPSRHLFPSIALIFRRLLARPRDRCCGSQFCIAFSSATFIPSSYPLSGRGGETRFGSRRLFPKKEEEGQTIHHPFPFPCFCPFSDIIDLPGKKKIGRGKNRSLRCGKQTGVSPLHDFCPKESKKKREPATKEAVK